MNLIDFTINNPQKQGLNDIMGYNESDLFFVQFYSDLPTNVVADCSNNYYVDISSGSDLSFNVTIDCSNNPTLDYTFVEGKTIPPVGNSNFCQKRELCKNVLNYKHYTKNTGKLPGGQGGYNGNDTNFVDHSQLYNFTILTTTNLSLGILLLGAAIYSYM